MPFSMTFQGNNQQNALAVDPAKGKTGEKAVFSQCGGDETTTYYDRAFKINSKPSRRKAAYQKHKGAIRRAFSLVIFLGCVVVLCIII